MICCESSISSASEVRLIAACALRTLHVTFLYSLDKSFYKGPSFQFAPLKASKSDLDCNTCNATILRASRLVFRGSRCYCCGFFNIQLLVGVTLVVFRTSVHEVLVFFFTLISELVSCRNLDVSWSWSKHTLQNGVEFIAVV